MRTATTDLCEGLANIMPREARSYPIMPQQGEIAVGNSCKPLGYLKHGYYRAFAQACYEFWGCTWNASGERFAVEQNPYDRIDLLRCFSAPLR